MSRAYTFTNGGWSINLESNGYRLPTEAEWEYAARGGVPDDLYPWGNTINSSDANYDIFVGQTSDAGTYPPNGYGLFDIAGNAWEWIHDWHGPSLQDGVTNPTGPGSGTTRVIRGGSWVSFDSQLQCAYRSSATPVTAFSDLGFRWARKAPGETVGISRIYRSQAATGVVIEWPSQAGSTYLVEWCEDLGEGYQVQSTGIPATPPTNMVLDPGPPLPRCFYRVRAE